ncbi:MAG: glycosyltransferase family 2 protein [Anaerolineae bacterium]
MTRLLAVILTKNEERHIRDCIQSVSWADGILISDSYSQDETVAIARQMGASIVQHTFVNFAQQRNTALADAKAMHADWVFFIDADERATPELGREIMHVIQDETVAGWWVPRYNYILGHRMRGGGWYPDHQLRLLHINQARYDPTREVHEVAILDGRQGYLQEHLIHFNYDTLAHFRTKQGRYLEFEAKILFDQGVHPRPWTYLSMPSREFWRRFITLKGYRDGGVGLLLCGLMGWYTFRTYLHLSHMHRHKSRKS